MARQLNFLLNRLVYCFIKLYQKYISKHTGRDCIYPISCSNYALKVLNKKSTNIFKDLYLIRTRIKGCKVIHIIQEDNAKWHAINGTGDVMFPEKLNDKMRSNIDNIVSKY